MVLLLSNKRCLALLPFLLALFSPTIYGVGEANTNTTVRCRANERQALHAFKEGIVDEYVHLSSWETPDCCTWIGVQCSNRTSHVVKLDLQGLEKQLKGTISSSLLGLQHLNYLDLSYNDFNGSRIPEFIGSLINLRYLYLFRTGFAGPIPFQLGYLSDLRALDLGWNENLYEVGKLEWLSNLSSLTFLDLSLSDLSEADNWVQVVNNLPSLRFLELMDCRLSSKVPSSMSLANSSSLLEHLKLSYNNLTSSAVFPWLFNVSRSNLVVLDLQDNRLDGLVPDAVGKMSSLVALNLSYNQLEGGIPESLGNKCALRSLDLTSNNISGELSGFIRNLSGCRERSLEELNLGWNQITGPLPNQITTLSSLRVLNVERNYLNGTIPRNISFLSKLEVLSLRQNFFEGVLSEVHFSNFSKLKILSLKDNSLALSFSSDWVPPFQLNAIYLGSCKLGPNFPRWLQTQKNYSLLDISNASIADALPNWFSKALPPNLFLLLLSYNKMTGKLPDFPSKFPGLRAIDLSSNNFEGPIPLFPLNLTFLDLSNNTLSGSISFLCDITGPVWSVLDLSGNLLSGELPDCWMQFQNLKVLDLANNLFSGKIPQSIGFLSQLESLSFRNNSFSGYFPSLENCTNLRVLDLGYNSLSGNIPPWIGESLPNLILLSLQSNRFFGNIPFQVCHLKYMQILDLSINNISGIMPNCLKNLTSLTIETSPYKHLSSVFFVGTQDGSRSGSGEFVVTAIIRWKGRKDEYSNTLGLVKMIDLSSNKLDGEIPEEIISLVGLIGLNLSRNYLTGPIPQNIGQLKSLDFLDLSHNQLQCEIPQSLSQIDRLGVLDLSENNLWGKIPADTQLQSFNASSYAGNPGLCGDPLLHKCATQDQNEPEVTEDKDSIITSGFYVSLVIGFVVGLWGVCGTLLLNTSWRQAYFRFLNKVTDWFNVRVALDKAQLQKGSGFPNR